MKILVIYYSRTGTTRKLAGIIAAKISADQEELIDTVNRSGVIGYLRAGKDAVRRSLTKLQPITKDLSAYDLIVIGTPVWASNMSTPVRTFLEENKDKIKTAAFFCTMGGDNSGKTFDEMERIIGKEPASVLALKTVEAVKDQALEKIEEFCKKI